MSPNLVSLDNVCCEFAWIIAKINAASNLGSRPLQRDKILTQIPSTVCQHVCTECLLGTHNIAYNEEKGSLTHCLKANILVFLINIIIRRKVTKRTVQLEQ